MAEKEERILRVGFEFDHQRSLEEARRCCTSLGVVRRSQGTERIQIVTNINSVQLYLSPFIFFFQKLSCEFIVSIFRTVIFYR